MCDPVTAITVASAGMQYQQGKAQARNQKDQVADCIQTKIQAIQLV